MELTNILLVSLWSALFATGLGVLFTAPLRYVPATFVCGFVARLLRDVATSGGLNQTWATLIAAAAVVVVGRIGRREASPVVLVSGVLPLGAAVSLLRSIEGIFKVSSLGGEALGAAAIELTADLSRVFATSLAIALGLGTGLLLAALATRARASLSRRARPMGAHPR